MVRPLEEVQGLGRLALAGVGRVEGRWHQGRRQRLVDQLHLNQVELADSGLVEQVELAAKC